ncbi:MAG: glycosyltransferase family 4 protein [Anaerolineae bacterium]
MSGYRVLMVAPTSFFSDTGCHVRILEEARALRQRGNDVAIATYRKGRDVDGFPIYRTAPLPWRQNYEVGSSRHKFAYDALLLLKVIERALKQRPDVIHAHMHEGALIGGVVAKVLRLPMVFDFQGSATSEMVDHRFLNPEGPWYRPMLWLERQIDRLPDAYVTSTRSAASLLEQWFSCPAERITPIPDCVNTAVWRPDVIGAEERAAMRQALGIPQEARVIAYLGLLAEHQGISLLLRAAAKVVQEHPDAYFLLMGYPNVDAFRAYAAGLGLGQHVVFTGQMPYDQAPRYLALGDVAVAPKLSATEGAGKLLNYMAMGLPIVTFTTPVNREYLGDLGLYADTKDEEGLAVLLSATVVRLPSLERLRAALRRKVMDQYVWDEAARQLEAIYGRVIGARASRRAGHGAH